MSEEALKRAERALSIFLGGDDRFLVSIGGNPIAIETMLGEAEEALATLRAALSSEPVDDRIGKWLSAALEDLSTCAEMKADIEAWFATRAALGETK